jgi:hypothetical protein
MNNREETLKVLLALKEDLPAARFVCIAADYAMEDKKITKAACQRFTEMIADRLRGEYTVDGWLRRYHGIDTVNYTPDVRLDYRQRWVDAMIEEFSS